MGSELAACPDCGARCIPQPTDSTVVVCTSPRCPYGTSRTAHNTLARHAEIGALVERIVDGPDWRRMWAVSEMSVEVALIVVDEMLALGAEKIYFHDNAPEAAIALGKEVRRLRAGVEAVRALPRFDLDGGYEDQCGVSRANCSDGAYMDADDVLAALEITDD